MSADSSAKPSYNSELEWLAANPEIKHITAAVTDLNGILRGKRLPVAQAEKILGGSMRMPPSSLSSDIWGGDIEDNQYADLTGDGDGICQYTGRGVLPVNWTAAPHAFIPLWMTDEQGEPFPGDPRGALAAVQKAYADLGLTPVVATELEFYLYSLEDGQPVAPYSPDGHRQFDTSGLLSIDEMDQMEVLFNNIYAACEAQDIPADAAISEGGAGQYEINLNHLADPLKVADNTVLFKRIIKGVARQQGYGATFMAKPYGDRAGNSMHVHFSVLDAEGNNIFDDGTEKGSERLLHAVGGLLEALPQLTLIFAPHYNSYRRLRPHSLAPTSVTWGYENRTAAIRIPGGPAVARRIEQRAAGADANPYLVLAAHLGAALEGMQQKLDPGAPVEGWNYEAEAPQIPTEWANAIDLFEQGEMAQKIFDPALHKQFISLKRHELVAFKQRVSEFEYASYLEDV
ncbi:glutamine synthetase family protein [Aliamphritea hakodatensis]|uniref:glutamine synthetase family protein n=1 Tax=Aliamphritea hakodatensis TaxID=2895352 RepID=UPI0022FD8EF2|nr:glutamine synthetase family protein [Aliamphritea hakodatensis]